MDYRLDIDRTQTQTRVEVTHSSAGYRLLMLSGEEASLFLSSGVLSPMYCKTGFYRCNKAVVWHLLLASAAIKGQAQPMRRATTGFYLKMSKRLSTRLGQGKITRLYRDGATVALQRKLHRVSTRLSYEEYVVANTLFEHPKTHLSQNDVEILLLLKPVNLNTNSINQALHRLVEVSLIQAIHVTDDITFYDVNTQPHAHIYCEQTARLFDAEIEGCILLTETEGGEKITVSKETTHSLSVRLPAN